MAIGLIMSSCSQAKVLRVTTCGCEAAVNFLYKCSKDCLMHNFLCPLRGFHIEISLPRTTIQSFIIGVDLAGSPFMVITMGSMRK